MVKDLKNFFSESYTSGQLTHHILVIGVILAACLVSYFIILYFLRRIGTRSGSSELKLQVIKLKKPFLVFLVVLSIVIIYVSFTPSTNEVEGMHPFIKQFFTIAVIFCVTWLFIKAIRFVRIIVLSKYDIRDKDNLKARKVYTQLRVLERITVFVIVLIAFSIALMTFDGIKRIGISLFASAGVAGIILGFAAQKVLGSVLAGFQIALTQPIRIDDVVIVEKEWGWIEEITLTYVVVRIWDKRRMILPTTYFIETPFQNWTRVSADILGSVFIYADYRVPVDNIREELGNILKECELWDGKIQNLQVTNASESTLELRVLMSAVDSPTAWDLRVHVREKLIEYLQKNFPDCLPRTRIEMNPENH
ncbi:mechanosensitive ion channel family protein [Bacteroidota bacterium]